MKKIFCYLSIMGLMFVINVNLSQAATATLALTPVMTTAVPAAIAQPTIASGDNIGVTIIASFFGPARPPIAITATSTSGYFTTSRNVTLGFTGNAEGVFCIIGRHFNGNAGYAQHSNFAGLLVDTTPANAVVGSSAILAMPTTALVIPVVIGTSIPAAWIAQ